MMVNLKGFLYQELLILTEMLVPEEILHLRIIFAVKLDITFLIFYFHTLVFHFDSGFLFLKVNRNVQLSRWDQDRLTNNQQCRSLRIIILRASPASACSTYFIFRPSHQSSERKD